MLFLGALRYQLRTVHSIQLLLQKYHVYVMLALDLILQVKNFRPRISFELKFCITYVNSFKSKLDHFLIMRMFGNV